MLEVAVLSVKTGCSADFEAAFAVAATLIAATPGYLSHELKRCLEVNDRYLLLVKWQTLEAHTIRFRGSPAYLKWKALLHHFYDPLPTVEHYISLQTGV